MVTGRLDQVISLSRDVLDRLERGDRLSQILPQARLVARLVGDWRHIHWLDFEIYGAANVPGQKRPLQTAEERNGFKIFWDLHAVKDPRSITVDDVISKWRSRADPDEEKDALIPGSIPGIERLIETYREPDEYLKVARPDESLQLITYHADDVNMLQRVRDCVHRFISDIWISKSEEKENIEIIGSDYRLVIDNLDALDTGVGQELVSALGLLRSDNPADWSAAALVCRNVILQLGRTLFPSEEETYESQLLGKSLDLKGEREKNRLTAFVDWHWRQAEAGVKKKLEQLSSLLDRVYSKGSQGKQRLRHAEAQQLVVDTFDLVSSLDALTELEPVKAEPSNTG